METKKCCRCKKKYPKTLEYFFQRIYKHKLTNGTIVSYEGFRSTCKKCHIIISNNKRIEKRCAEMGCNVSDYRENWLKQMARAKTLYPELIDISPIKKPAIRKKLRNGYQFTTYEQYKKDCGNNISKAKRKYDYGQVDRVSIKMRQDMYQKVVTNARAAMIMGLSVKEVPKEIIETKRTLIILKREAGLTHSTKKY